MGGWMQSLGTDGPLTLVPPGSLSLPLTMSLVVPEAHQQFQVR